MLRKVFISYSRWNSHVATRLRVDLERAGFDAWFDAESIPLGHEWRRKIEEGINESEQFILLASPESATSIPVTKELELASALGRSPFQVLVGGKESDLPPDWSRRQMVDATRGQYWMALKRLLKELGASQTDLPHLCGWELIGRAAEKLNIEEIAGIIGHATELSVNQQNFGKIPIEPTGYTMTWLIGPKGIPFEAPERIAVFLNFSGTRGAESEKLVIPVWTKETNSPWVVMVEGPVNKENSYELTEKHVWEDAIEASARALAIFGKGRPVGIFHCSPVELAFGVGSKFREMSPYRLYRFTRGKGSSGAYVPVYDRW